MDLLPKRRIVKCYRSTSDHSLNALQASSQSLTLSLLLVPRRCRSPRQCSALAQRTISYYMLHLYIAAGQPGSRPRQKPLSLAICSLAGLTV